MPNIMTNVFIALAATSTACAGAPEERRPVAPPQFIRATAIVEHPVAPKVPTTFAGGGTMTYAFDDSDVYQVFASPMDVTRFALEPGEELCGPITLDDPSRWGLKSETTVVDGVSQTHVYVRPFEPGLKSSALVTTDRRTYRIYLESREQFSMAEVRWTYSTATEGSSPPAKTECIAGHIVFTEF